MKDAAEHISVAISARFAHPSEDKALEAISRLGAHNKGHSEIEQLLGVGKIFC